MGYEQVYEQDEQGVRVHTQIYILYQYVGTQMFVLGFDLVYMIKYWPGAVRK